jgi:acyl-CoA thioester hydrolase
MSSDPTGSHSFSLRVRYAETDQMGVAHHAAYFVWFELARSEFCRSRGIDYSAMESDGLFLPVVEAKCRYRQGAKYDEELLITATVVEVTKRTMRTLYTVHRDGALLAEGETTQILVNREGRPRTFPEEVASRLKR